MSKRIDTPKTRSPKSSPEVRNRAVRMVQDQVGDSPSQWEGNRLDRGQDRLHGADAVQLGALSRA